jgi:hypothetical protein
MQQERLRNFLPLHFGDHYLVVGVLKQVSPNSRLLLLTLDALLTSLTLRALPTVEK